MKLTYIKQSQKYSCLLTHENIKNSLRKNMKPPTKELIADGNRQKPPRAKSVPSTTSSDAPTLLGEIEDDITSSASESYPQEDSSSNEGNFINDWSF